MIKVKRLQERNTNRIHHTGFLFNRFSYSICRRLFTGPQADNDDSGLPMWCGAADWRWVLCSTSKQM